MLKNYFASNQRHNNERGEKLIELVQELKVNLEHSKSANAEKFTNVVKGISTIKAESVNIMVTWRKFTRSLDV